MCFHILPSPSGERSIGFDSERICESQIDHFVMAITSAEAAFRHADLHQMRRSFPAKSRGEGHDRCFGVALGLPALITATTLGSKSEA
jgi:Tfp pilus assembly protein PilX